MCVIHCSSLSVGLFFVKFGDQPSPLIGFPSGFGSCPLKADNWFELPGVGFVLLSWESVGYVRQHSVVKVTPRGGVSVGGFMGGFIFSLMEVEDVTSGGGGSAAAGATTLGVIGPRGGKLECCSLGLPYRW